MKEKVIRDVIKDTIPVIAGYMILGIGFGVIISANGWSMWIAVAMSLFIYAGSMQYAAIGLFTGGASFLTVALTTLAVNARHLFYGISMLEKYKDAGAKKPYLIFALTDETYSLVCSTDRDANYCFMVSLFNQIIISIVIISLVTMAIRFMPFILFQGRQTPAWLEKLGKSLPYAVMGMLVVYCLKGVSFSEASGYLPALIATLAVSLSYIWKKNTLLSIILGTVLYMILVQCGFV